MLRLTEIRLPIDHDDHALKQAVLDRLTVDDSHLLSLMVYRRNYDARKKSAIFFSYSVDVETDCEAMLLTKFAKHPHIRKTPDMAYRFVTQAPTGNFRRPIVIGFGPCGMFAALILAQSGFRPIVLERGKKVRERTQDTFGFWRKRELNPESNVQFGEGGAGTFSDGKLHTQIRDPKHYGRKVLEEFVKAGAPEEILYIGKPHIGTFRLVKMVEQLRKEIIALGGEFYFESRVDDLLVEKGHVKGVVLQNGETFQSDHVLMAPGHSARDTFEMLHRRGVSMEAKPFSIGFRVEHPQSLIDTCRLGLNAGNPLLGAADYKLVHHCKNGRTVYSFCMCPGGTVVAAASEPGHLVTNGMSQYSRNERNANAAIVVNVNPDDFNGKNNPLAGIAFQRELEQKAFVLGGGNYNAPCQCIGDFLKNIPSKNLGKVTPSYAPGVTPCNLAEALPDFAIEALREAIPAFEKSIPGFSMADAVLTGTETRTSSPVRIVRNRESFESISVKGLYPAGEGAGYAGGILSSAIDGIEAAQAIALSISTSSENIN
ncbi:MAG: NAD(P)/FAD-dependent oxidoreductase [Oxalobacter sp.]